MADKFFFRSGFELLRALPVKSGVAIQHGEHLMLSGGGVTPVGATTDNLAFYCTAAEAHSSTDLSGTITCSIRNANAIFEVDLDAATDITFGDNLQLESGATQSLAKSDTDAVAVAVESKLQATAIRCVYTLPNDSSGLRHVGDAS